MNSASPHRPPRTGDGDAWDATVRAIQERNDIRIIKDTTGAGDGPNQMSPGIEFRFYNVFSSPKWVALKIVLGAGIVGRIMREIGLHQPLVTYLALTLIVVGIILMFARPLFDPWLLNDWSEFSLTPSGLQFWSRMSGAKQCSQSEFGGTMLSRRGARIADGADVFQLFLVIGTVPHLCAEHKSEISIKTLEHFINLARQRAARLPIAPVDAVDAAACQSPVTGAQPLHVSGGAKGSVPAKPTATRYDDL